METSPRRATADDVEAITATLTAAFLDDPVMRWAHRDDRTRADRLAGQWRVIAARGYVPRGACTIVSDHDAVALWMPPGAHLGEAFWAEHGTAFAEAVGDAVERLGLLGGAMAEHHPHDRDHWYLLAIGVHPHAQGHGLGSVLLAHTLAIGDREGHGAYLEATSPRSRALYERFGFEVVGTVQVADAPPMWAMWREPVRTVS